MVAVPDAGVEPVLVSDPDRGQNTDHHAVIAVLLGPMRDPSFAARGAVPALAAVAADRDPHLVGALARPGPDVGPLGRFLPNRSAVRIGPVGMKPAQQTEDHTLGAERLHTHGLVVTLGSVAVGR